MTVLRKEGWTADGEARRFDRAFEVAALERMAAGEGVSALGREFGVRRKLPYQWREAVRRGGVEALRGVGRPPGGARLASAVERPCAPPPPAVAAPDELALAGERIAALERKSLPRTRSGVGQQTLKLDFLSRPCGP